MERAAVRRARPGARDVRPARRGSEPDDVAAVHATLHGTHRAPWQGLAPTGRTIAVEHMFFFRFTEERITDVWEMLDRPAMTAQLQG
ncbi:ester cyclase [Isoptericola sp. AK164]|uniref:ester cyclase n=1 Tax=Isoptericola sp. AK164 TaxID=3024246 RepID=UPI0024184AD4|nr:ester cyclase [Isoptericola sp. AK164]